MKQHLTIIQNFLINDRKLQHLKSPIGLEVTAKILGECKFIVNCKSKNFQEVKELYEKYITNLIIFNWQEDKNFTWAKTTFIRNG